MARLHAQGGYIVSTLKIGRPYDPVTWTCAHAVADYYGFEFTDGDEWARTFMYWLRHKFERRGKFAGTWRDHMGEMITCRYGTGTGLHVGIVVSGGIYHAYRAPGKSGGDTVVTGFAQMTAFHDVRFYRYVG